MTLQEFLDAYNARPRAAFLAVGGLLCVIRPLPAQGPSPLVTDRPDFTESAVAVGAGTVQLEAGYTVSNDGAVDTHTLGEVLIRLGILKSTEIRLGINSYTWTTGAPRDDQGWEDATLGVKRALSRGAPGFHPLRPAVAIILATSLPTGAGGPGEDHLQPEAVLAAAWNLSERLGLGANLRVAAPLQDGERYAQAGGSVSLGAALMERLSGYVEYFAFVPERHDGPAAGFLDGGFTLQLTPDLQVDLRGGLGVHGTAADYFVGAGFGWRR